jgi:hypothetical protein
LLKSLQRRGDEFVTEETFGAIFDEQMQKDLLSLLEFYKTSHSSTNYEIEGLPDQKFKEVASKFSQLAFLPKESLEKNVLKPFFTLNKDKAIPEGEELINLLLNFYYEERLASIKIISWLIKPSSDVKPEIIALCRSTLNSLLSSGLIENASSQLINLSSITVPTSITKENRNELAFAWIHQNVLEQKEMAKIIFELLSCDFSKILIEVRSKLVFDLIKNNFGLSNFERYNLDAETVNLAREAFWFRQCSAIRALDLKGLISASVSSSNILTALNPMKPSDLSKILASFKSEVNHDLTSPFKLAWSLLVGFLDSLEILDNNEILMEYSKIASKCVDTGVFKIIFDLLDENNFIFESPSIKTSLKSLFKDIYTAFFTVFDSDRSSSHFPLLTEGLIRIFSKENSLCEEFWYVDSQFSGRTSVLKHWINRFPHDFITLVRLICALASGPVCSEIVSDFIFKGFDHIYVERCSDRGNVIEDYDLKSEVYNLTVEKTMEIHSCGVGLILGIGTKGVMMAGFNERPMVNWSTKIYPFHFLLRVLQISQDFSVNFFILEIFEKLMNENEDFSARLYQHLQVAAPLFTESTVNNLPSTLVDLLLFVLEQPNPKALIMSKCLNCLVFFETVFDLNFFSNFMQISSNIMDGITSVLKRCVYNVEIDGVTFEVFDSVLKFSEVLLNLCNNFNQERPEECSILLKSLKETVFNFIIEHVGKWRFISQTHRIRLLAEVCRLILSLESSYLTSDEVSIGHNFALLNTIIALVHDLSQDSETFFNGKLFIENGIDASIYFQCLTRAIEYACDEGNLTIAEYFGNYHISTPSGSQSPFNIIANCLSHDYLVLPVLLFFQYVFQKDQFALNVRISRESLEILSSAMCRWFEPVSRDKLPKVRSAALAVLNNTACTRPDIFLFIFSQNEESFVNLFIEGISRNVLDQETKLLSGICSILWTSVSEFTLVINSFKKKTRIIDNLIKLLSIEWSESQTPLAHQIISSIFEVLAVEFCYFNLTQKIQHSNLKTCFEPEKFIKKISLFKCEFPDSFSTFVESFSIFSSSCLALKDETEFNRKILKSLVLIIEKLDDFNFELVEMICKNLNFGLLQSIGDCFETGNGNGVMLELGHELYNSLITKMISILSGSIDGDLSTETDKRIELVCLTGTLLNIDDFKWTNDQVSNLFGMMSSILTILRHFLALQSRNSRKVSAYLKLLISSIGALKSSSELVHFLRREGVLKTIFSLIRNYRDSEALILFTSGVCSKFDFIIEELLSTEILDSFIIETFDDEAKFIVEFISLLSIIRIRFDSNCVVSEKICTVLYGCNIQGRLEILKKTPGISDFLFCESLLPLLKLLSSSLERSTIEAPATEALLSNLIDNLFGILINLTSPDSSKEQENLISLIISTLFTFTIYGNPKNPLRKNLKNLLFPYDHQIQRPVPSQYASVLHTIIIMAKYSEETIEFSKQILKLNCPESLKNELENFLIKK